VNTVGRASAHNVLTRSRPGDVRGALELYDVRRSDWMWRRRAWDNYPRRWRDAFSICALALSHPTPCTSE